MITGKDDVSLAVLTAFNSKQKIADIAATHNISIDQAKRLKRYYNYSRQLAYHGHEFMLEQFHKLGLKGLALASLFKEKDYEALADVLSQVDMSTNRDELGHLVAAVKAKRSRIAHFVDEIDRFKIDIAEHTAMLHENLNELKAHREKVLQQLPQLESYPTETHTFLMEYVGPYEGGWALRKRLDSGFRRALEKKNIIKLNDFIWEICDLDGFVEQYLKRLKRGHYIEWDYEREQARNPLASASAEYSAVKSGQQELLSIERKMKQIEHQIQQNEADLRAREQEFETLKGATLQSFEEASISSDAMSKRDLIRHAELQTRAMKWLYMQGAVACSELTLPNGRRADVIGYLPDGQVVIIEVKVSYQDYTRDEKWQEYLPYCDQFYFAMDFTPNEQNVGHLQPHRQSFNIERNDLLQHACKDRAAIQMLINRALSKRFIYGFK